MRKIINHLTVLLLAFSFGVFVVWKQNATDRQDVWSLTKQFHQAFVNNDENLFERLLTEDFKYRGYRIAEDKSSILAGIKMRQSKPNDVESEKITPFWIRVDNEKAYVVCLIQVKYLLEDGKTVTHRGIYTFTYEKKYEDWKLAFLNQDDNFSTFEENEKRAKQLKVEDKIQKIVELATKSFWEH